MQVRKYNPETDFEQIKTWGKGWEANYDKDLFPPLGFIVPGVCAYFIYETNSKVCWLENMVRNPEVPKEVADKGLELVATACLKEINTLGYKVAYATTASEAVIDRALRHGATAFKGQTLLQVSFK